MELASATGSSSTTSGPSPSNPGTPYLTIGETSASSGLDASPLVLPASGSSREDVPEMTLEDAVDEVDRSDPPRQKTI